MGVVVTFQGFTPPAREDGEAWANALVFESASEAGPWTQIDTVQLSPVDVDPSAPVERNFTTEEGTLEQGWYYIQYEDANGDLSSDSPPIFNSPAANYAYLPSLAEVGARLRNRTRDDGGNLVGTFNANTEPTGPQANHLIQIAATDVADVIGVSLDESLYQTARSAVSLRAAMLIELTYFDDQVQTGRSPYQQLKEMFDDKMKTLTKAVEQVSRGELPGAVDDGALALGDGFPETAIGMEFPW